VVQFLRQAARDPNVIAIKQTLYRTSKDSPIVAALIEAAENGKNVVALVEIKARFDEEANLRWARDLERAGRPRRLRLRRVEDPRQAQRRRAPRGRGVEDLLPLRHRQLSPRDSQGLHRPQPVQLDPVLGRDAGRVFNYITGYAEPEDLEALVVSPLNMKSTLIELIGEGNVSGGHGQAGGDLGQAERPGGSRDHRRPVPRQPVGRAHRTGRARHLLPASGRAGPVGQHPGQVDRRPLPGAQPDRLPSPTVATCPHDKAKLFISSADWMPRNLDRRVELMTPIRNATVHDQVLDQIMVANLKDDAQSWVLDADGDYRRVSPRSGRAPSRPRVLHDQSQPLGPGTQGQEPARSPALRAALALSRPQ
jgi:polyphosphate kinase